MPLTSTPRLHKRIILLAAIAWSLLVAFLLFSTFRDIEREAMDMAHAEAQANLNKDISFRRWATQHGGIYVPITATQQPVPWLSHIPDRDITATDGRRLTLLNPASALRQIMDRYAIDYGVRGRITGLRQLNPGNAPDAWERKQLEAFTRGEKKEVWEVADLDGKPHLRHLRAMYMEPGCDKCHAILGYKTGDMRGATGVNLPLAPYLERISAAEDKRTLNYGALWFLGLTGIGWAAVRLGRSDTHRAAQARDLAQAELRFRTLYELSRDGIVIVDPESKRFLEFNEVAHTQLGYSREEFATRVISDIEIVESPEETKQHVDRIMERGWDDFETQHRRKDGAIRDIQVVVQRLTVDGREVLYCTYRDITERKFAERATHLYANIFRHSGEAIMVTDRENRIVAVNPSFTRLTGYDLEDIRGQDPRVLSSGRTPRDTYRAMWNGLEENGFWQGELWDRRKNGTAYPKWAALSVIRGADGQVQNYIASFTDISQRKADEQRIDYLAHHDALTGLINRYSLESSLDQILHGARRSREQVAVMFIDMDRFKSINDTLGHHMGDRMLVEIGHRLRGSVRESDVVARLGGDEFVVVLTAMTASLSAAGVAAKVIQTLGEPYLIEGITLHSSPSIGISLYPADGEDSETLMKAADTAMYHAKERGRNNFQFFTASLNAATSERLDLERELRAALRARHLELHYQPKVRGDDGSLHGVEALVRWRHPQRGMIPPLKFIPVAEESGLIEPLGEWVLDEACRQLAAWRGAGIRDITMAINLSTRQLHSPNLATMVGEMLRRHGLAGASIELEITESAAMTNPDHAISQLHALRKLGVELAIDDFGTGYSSLAYLKLLPIQTLKLDRTFVRDIETDENDAAISAATLALAHSLGLKVVAEGVETAGQMEFLQRHRCDYLQGYLFDQPQPPEVLLARWKAG